METRQCKECGKKKELFDFPFNDKKRGWRKHRCRECSNAKTRKKYDPDKNREYRIRYTEKNPGKVAESKRRWRDENHDFELSQARLRQKERWESDPEYRQKMLNRSADWKAKNADQQKDYRDRRYSENKQQLLDAAKKYRLKMTDAYIGSCLKARGFKPHQITPNLIKAQREIVRIKRTVKEINHA